MKKKKIIYSNSSNPDQEKCKPDSGCCSSFEKDSPCKPVQGTAIQRRDLIKAMGLAAGVGLFSFPALSIQESPEKSDGAFINGIPEFKLDNNIVIVLIPDTGMIKHYFYI